MAPLRLRMSAACPRSATSPSSRCSTDVPGKVHGALDHLRGVLRKELVAAALDPRQGRDGPVGLVAQAADIHPDTPQEERGERIVLADKHAQNMERLDSLLSALPGKRQCTLQSLLRFYS